MKEIEVEVTMPSGKSSVTPFYGNEARARKFVEAIKERHPEAKVEVFFS